MADARICLTTADSDADRLLTSPEATIAFYDRNAKGAKRLVLDVGAATGRDGACLASLGFDVVAAKPAAGMRREGLAPS